MKKIILTLITIMLIISACEKKETFKKEEIFLIEQTNSYSTSTYDTLTGTYYVGTEYYLTAFDSGDILILNDTIRIDHSSYEVLYMWGPALFFRNKDQGLMYITVGYIYSLLDTGRFYEACPDSFYTTFNGKDVTIITRKESFQIFEMGKYAHVETYIDCIGPGIWDADWPYRTPRYFDPYDQYTSTVQIIHDTIYKISNDLIW